MCLKCTKNAYLGDCLVGRADPNYKADNATALGPIHTKVTVRTTDAHIQPQCFSIGLELMWVGRHVVPPVAKTWLGLFFQETIARLPLTRQVEAWGGRAIAKRPTACATAVWTPRSCRATSALHICERGVRLVTGRGGKIF